MPTRCANWGGFSWEWSNGNELWDSVVVKNLFARCGSSSCLVSTAAVGQQFVDSEGSVFCVKKWKIVTTRSRLIEVMAPYSRIPEHLGPADFRPCSGKVCADSAFYTPFFAELVWRPKRPRSQRRRRQWRRRLPITSSAARGTF